jgi:hypothetical protein
MDRDNPFYPSSENRGLYDEVRKMNAINARNMEINQSIINRSKLAYEIRDDLDITRCIRNVDHERPMMFPEFRFKHLYYCTHASVDGYTVCKQCNNCGFNLHTPARPGMFATQCDNGPDKDWQGYPAHNMLSCNDYAPARTTQRIIGNF